MTHTVESNQNPGPVTNVAKDQAHVDVQVGVVHGDTTIYHVGQSDPPQRKYEVGLNFLHAGMARRAEELICEAVASGYTSQALAYHWMLAVLSGRSFEHLTVADMAKLRKARDIAKESPRDSWSDAIDVITGLVDCTAAQEVMENANLEQIAEVMGAFTRLPQKQQQDIAGHLDMILTGTLQDHVEKTDVESAREHRRDNDRERRVPLFFEPEPVPPRPIFPRPFLDDASTAKLVIGLILWGIGTLIALGMMFSNSVPASLVASVLWVAGCLVFFNSAPQWLWLRRQIRVAMIPSYGSTGSSWQVRTTSNFPVLFANITRALDKAFREYTPADGQQRSHWETSTQQERAKLAEELTAHYHDVKAADIYWLIKQKAQAAAERWKRQGTVLPQLRHPSTVAPELERPSTELTAKVAIGAGALSLATLITAVNLTIYSPVGSFFLAILLIPGTVLAFLGAIPLLQRKVREKVDAAERDRRLAEETEFFHRWKNYLDTNRPTDAEMGQWLDYDLRCLKATAMRQYGLSSREIIVHVTLTEPAVGCLRARYVFGPPRYDRYIVTIFLLTDSGVRQWSTTLYFASAAEANEQRQSFRYDAIAMAKVAEAGRTVHDQRRYYQFGRLDLADQSKVIYGRVLRIMLMSGDGDAINILIENFDDEFADHREKDKRQLYEMAIDSSGVAAALRVLEAVAADGRQWIERDRERRHRQARLYMDKDDAGEDNSGPNDGES